MIINISKKNNHRVPANKGSSGYYIDPAAMDWEANKAKREADGILFRHISYDLRGIADRCRKRPISVLCLPGSSWGWEERLEEEFNERQFRFMGVERNPAVHQRLVAATADKCWRFETTPNPTDVRDYLRQDRGRFDIIYLDWMGTWSLDKIEDLRVMMSNYKIEPGGLLILTMSLGRGKKAVEQLSRYKIELQCPFYDARGRMTYVNHPKVCCVSQAVAEMSAEVGITTSPIFAQIYYSESGYATKSTPQLRIIMRCDTSPLYSGFEETKAIPQNPIQDNRSSSALT